MSEDAVARTVGELVELAHQSRTSRAFEGALLALLQRSVGFDIGFVSKADRGHELTLTGLEAERAHVGLGTGPFASRMTVHRAIYDAELAPVKRAALAARGVAVDTEVLGTLPSRSCAYHRDLAAPVGGKHSLLAYPHVRGRPFGVVMLGRTGSAFAPGEVARVEGVLPAIALGLESLARSEAAATVPLTAREREVLQYLCLGYTNREIALACGSSPNTVRNQLAAVFVKLGATTRAEAVAIALRGAA